MSAATYQELTVAQLNVWGNATIAALQAANVAAMQAAGAGEITQEVMQATLSANDATIAALNTGASQLVDYAEQAFAQGAGG